MKRILLLLLAVIGCQAVDQLYPNFPNGTAAPDTVVISGAASSTAPLAGQVKIGGGQIWAQGMGVFRGGILGGVAQADEVRISGGGISTAQAMLIGIAGGSGETKIYGTAPVTVAANSTSVGGGYIRTSDTVMIDNGTVRLMMGQGAITGYLGTQSNHNLNIRTNNADRIVIDKNGSTIIGTDPNPGGVELMRVGGSAYVKTAVEIDGTDPWLKMRQAGATAFTMQWDNANMAMQYSTTGKHKFIGGPVIIGTDPGTSELLRVGGSVRIQSQTTILGLTGNSATEATAALRLGNVSALNKFLSAGYDSIADVGYIQSLHSGVQNKPLRLQPNGDVVTVGTDPGGSELLRIGGSSRVAGNLFLANSLTSTGANTVATASSAVVDFLGAARLQSYGPDVSTYGIIRMIQRTSDATARTVAEFDVSGALAISGNVAIGTTAVNRNLAVIGTITSKEIKVTTSGADYVFENEYKLRSLAEVEQFIAEHKHLPEMMSAKAMQADGMPVSEVVTKQLAKIEELTLYAIKSDRERQAQTAVVEKQADRLAALEKQVADMAAANAKLVNSVQLLLTQVEQVAAKK